MTKNDPSPQIGVGEGTIGGLPARRRLRILQVHTPFGFGGIELWLWNVFRRIDTSLFEVHVFAAEMDAFHRAAIEAIGGTILLSPKPRQLWAYLQELRKVLRTSGPYDIVHCNF